MTIMLIVSLQSDQDQQSWINSPSDRVICWFQEINSAVVQRLMRFLDIQERECFHGEQR